MKKERLETSCKSISFFIEKNINEGNNKKIDQLLINDLAYKFSKIQSDKEKFNICLDVLAPYVPKPLSPMLEYAKSVTRMEKKGKYDVLIFTVVPAEFRTILKAFDLPEKHNKDLTTQDIRFWETTLYSEQEQQNLSCLVSMIGESTNAKAAIAISIALARFDVDLTVLVGIAAGSKDKSKFGDVVIASQVMDYETQRLEPDGNKKRPNCHSIDAGLSKQVNFFLSSQVASKKDFGKYFKEKEKGILEETCEKCTAPRISKSVILAGDKLLADGLTVELLINDYHEQARAVEMEANGFVLACESFNIPWMIFRGISDFGDPGKPELKKFQPNAALSAILACKLFIEKDYSPVSADKF